MGYCSCWRDYPNEAHKCKSGKWMCVDKYSCIRQGEYKEILGRMQMLRKTVCVKISEGNKHEKVENQNDNVFITFNYEA